MAFSVFGTGRVTRKTGLSYTSEGKPYIFFTVESPKDFVKEGGNPCESDDFSLFGNMAEDFDSGVNEGDYVTVWAKTGRRKKDEKWETQLLVDKVQIGDHIISYATSKKS
jgi:single-stranded DNA-binding protein